MSSRTKLLDRKYNTRDARLFIIATEGKETEKQYFGIFHNPRIKIEVLATGEDGKSAPQYVIERLNEFVKKYDLTQEDSRWLMFDVDRWGEKNLSLVCREAKQKGYGLAISKPCFEVWLHLHIDDLDPSDTKCQDFEERLRAKLGSYNKSNLNIDWFKEHINEAVERAKHLHPSHQENWPSKPGSHVYRVIEILLETIKDF